jgi:thiamine-phosphate pyrophosphorylase
MKAETKTAEFAHGPAGITQGAVRGLYAVTPELADTAELLDKAEAALAGGARLLQYRSKRGDPALRLRQARGLASLCRRYGAPLIVNDHLELALESEADGLHLGREDGQLADARSRLGPQKILGVSCYDRIGAALEAARAGADYVAFGSFFPSLVKPEAVRPSITVLRDAKVRTALPVVAIGGITVENAPTLIAAGADSLAVISALFDAPDIEAAARRFSALFARANGI